MCCASAALNVLESSGWFADRSLATSRSLASHLDVEPEAVFGHSFGGKVALSYLQECQQQSRVLPRQVWVLDSLPGTGSSLVGLPTRHTRRD
jgi:pimeloyl-ACP methyl ester carboxylesterase